jgi:DNA-binding CsgD family transcriptional regulator
MSTITDRQYQQLLSGIAELHNCQTLNDFPSHVLPVVNRLVSTDSSYCVSFQNELIEVIACDTNFSTLINHITPDYFVQHPVLNHHLRTGDWSAFKGSDFLSEAEYHRCDALYEQTYKGYDIEDFFIFSIPDPVQPPNPQKWSLQLLVYDRNFTQRIQQLTENQNSLGNLGLGLNRSDRSFTETDRTLLNLLRGHIFHAYQSLQRYSAIQAQMAQLSELTEFLGLIAFSIDGQVNLLTNRATRLLAHYFPTEWSNRNALPESLQQYCQKQLQKLRQPDISPLLPPLERLKDNHRLIIRFVPALLQSEIILVLEEYTASELAIDTFRQIGLTKRQSEILFYLTQGKTNKEIAQQLGRDATTIKKHLDGIYAALQVSGRIEAVAAAYTKLGMLQVND